MSDPKVDTERVSVRTYVPRYQREQWDEHAEELDMSRSEFVRTMVQAGRRSFDEADAQDPAHASDPAESVDQATGTAGASSPGSTPTGDLRDQVLAALSTDEYRSWDELLAVATEDIEDRLEATLQELQEAGRVTHSGRNGGYTLDE